MAGWRLARLPGLVTECAVCGCDLRSVPVENSTYSSPCSESPTSASSSFTWSASGALETRWLDWPDRFPPSSASSQSSSDSVHVCLADSVAVSSRSAKFSSACKWRLKTQGNHYYSHLTSSSALLSDGGCPDVTVLRVQPKDGALKTEADRDGKECCQH